MPFNIPTLDDILGQYGVSTLNLMDPGARYGYGNIQGSPYSQFFTPYNISQFDEARQSLEQLQQGLLSDVKQQYSQTFQDLQSKTAGRMGEAFGAQSKSGFSGAGLMDRFRQQLGQTGLQQIGQAKGARQSSLTGIEESIGSKYGQLAGTIGSFLRGQASQALGIKQADTTGGTEEAADSNTVADEAFISSLRDLLDTTQMNIFDSYLSLSQNPSRAQVRQMYTQVSQGTGYNIGGSGYNMQGGSGGGYI